MPSLDLEIISSGPAETKEIELGCHVNKYTESFLYTEKLAHSNAPIAYYEAKNIDPWVNIKISDQTHVIPVNDIDLISETTGWMKINASTFTAPYRDIILTHKATFDEYGKSLPLFYRHDLPEGTVQAEVSIVENGEKIEIENGMIIAVEDGCIYTNYKNFYNKDTGSYRLHFVSSSNSDGETVQELLNPQPVIKEATYADIDLDPESPNFGTPIGLSWSRLEGHSGNFGYVINNGGATITNQACEAEGEGQDSAFYLKPLSTSAIRLKLPSGRDPNDPWNIKITNGFFWYNNNRYYLPEYDQQPFNPEKPYIYSPYRKMMYVNKNTLITTRKNINVDINSFMHLTVYVENLDGELSSVYTTDKALFGKRYSNTEVFYEDGINCWDNSGGFVVLNLEVDPNESFYADYYYKADDYEYVDLVLNPIQNKASLEHTFVFYIIPNVDEGKAVHYIQVDANGVIVSTSQRGLFGEPNLSLTMPGPDGGLVYNPMTAVGRQYQSKSADCFKNSFCVPYINSFAYYILGEVSIVDIADKEESLIIDLTAEGGQVREKYFEKVIRANPKVLHSNVGAGKDGQSYPENNVSWIRAPITLLEEYGGDLKEEAAKRLIESFSPVANYNVIEWSYNNCELDGHSTSLNEVVLKMSWEGPGLTYNIYRRTTLAEEWGDPLVSLSNPPEGEVEYIDNDVTSGLVYYYGVKIVENNTEFPFGNTLGVLVR